MEETHLLLILIIANDFNVKKKRKKGTKRLWMRKWRLAMRHEKSDYYNIIAELQNSDTKHYRNYLQVSHKKFQVILMTFISSFPPCLLRLKRDMS